MNMYVFVGATTNSAIVNLISVWTDQIFDFFRKNLLPVKFFFFVSEMAILFVLNLFL